MTRTTNRPRHAYIIYVWMLLALLTIQPLAAQGPDPDMPRQERRGQRGDRPPFDRERFIQELSAYITREAGLTAREAQQFFPVFFEMKEAQHSLERQKGQALRQAATTHMTERDCQRVLDLASRLDQKAQRLDAAYIRRLTRIVGARKVVKALAADRKFGRRMFHKMTRG